MEEAVEPSTTTATTIPAVLQPPNDETALDPDLALLEPARKGRRLNDGAFDSSGENVQPASRPPTPQQPSGPEFSIVDVLPRELVLRIFLQVGAFDLYRQCAFVSKSWHSFITKSVVLFEHLLRCEFDTEDVDDFLASGSENMTRLHRMTLNSEGVFSRRGLPVVFDNEQMHTLWRQHLLEKRHTLSPAVATFQGQTSHLGFGRLLLGRYGDSATLHDLPAYSFHRNSFANNPTQDWTVFNLAKIVPDFMELFDILRVPFVFHVTMPNLASCEVVFLDADLSVIWKRACEYVGRTFFVGDYPAGVRYAAISRRPRALRLILPCKSGSLKHAGMRRFFLHSNAYGPFQK